MKNSRYLAINPSNPRKYEWQRVRLKKEKKNYFFDNLRCPGQRSKDTRTSTNPRRTRNTLLARVPR